MTSETSTLSSRRRVNDHDDPHDDLAVGLYWTDASGVVLRANEGSVRLLGLTDETFVGRRFADFHLDEDVADDLLAKMRSGRSVRNVEARMRHSDGSVRYVLLSANPIHAMGEFLHVRAVMRDITASKQAEFALRQFKEMVDSAYDPIVGKSLDGTITYWNRAAEQLYGYTAEEMVGKSIGMIIPPEMPNELSEIMSRVARGERVDHYETQRLRKDGGRVDVSVSISPLIDTAGRVVGATAISRDVTERKRAEESLRHSAFHDALTGLPNRVFFGERVAQALDRMRRDSSYHCAVLFLDFDGFKLINDSLGHATGDRLLQMIAERLTQCVRPGDVVARLGGDEFTVLLEDVVNDAEVQRATKRLKECLATPHAIDDRQIVMTASIGVASGDAGYERAEDLVRDADIAMYRAKELGPARAETFNVDMRVAAHQRFGITTDLREAIERKEFRLVYQPIVDLVTGKVHSFEALLRWDHRTRGEVMPTEFIPVAERTGLIVPLGVWALTEACRQASEWQGLRGAKQEPIHVSVNLSAKQIVREQIVGEVREALREASLDPRVLHLEITEGVLLENGEISTARLEALRQLNVELHVDDFGTGYSWLSYLPRFPLQAIKIDRSFVNRMGARRTDLTIVRSIIELASNLGLGVIAEGVESMVQRSNLIRFGCALGQGFLFSKPVSATAARALVHS